MLFPFQTMGMSLTVRALIFAQASIVKDAGVKLAVSLTRIRLPGPPLWNPCPTSPGTNCPPDPTTLPELPPIMSLAFPSSGHQLTRPGAGETHLHSPAPPALKIDCISDGAKARLKICTSSI